MFSNKIFHFVKGYVIIDITGFNVERFMYICARRNITVFKITKRDDNKIRLCINTNDYFKLNSVRLKTDTHIRIVKKCGLPFILRKLKKRYLLISSFIVLLILFFISSLFIWSVEIKGDEPTTNKNVLSAVDKAGIHIGAYKPSLLNGEDLKNIILNNTDNLTWAWVYIKGTKAIVEYKEGIPAPTVVDKSSPCDIVAARDGIIEKIIAKSGKIIIDSGSTVTKDDVIISGNSESNDTVRSIHSIGDIYAHTWHEKSGEYKLYKYYYQKLNEKKSYRTLKFFSKCFDLFKTESVDFENYCISEKLQEIKLFKNTYTGIGLYTKTYTKTLPKKINLPYTVVENFAINELEEKIAKELLPSSRLIDKNVISKKIDDETISVTVTMEFTENIGKERPISQ